MNLKKLFEIQRELDEHIEREHPREEGEDRLGKKILALQVELGELANTWRGFKYWSNNQSPRTKCPHCEETGLCHYFGYVDPLQPCDYCGGYPERINPLLEEYVDCLHFILSIGLDLRMDEVADELEYEHASDMDIIECFVDLNSYITDLYYIRENDDMNSYCFESLFSKFIRLGELLGFTWEEIEQAYMEKNRVNHKRQESGY